MLCKYVLTVAGIKYELPNFCMKNWDEIRYSRKRSGLEGVVRAFTSKFEFVGKAYELIINEYLLNYLNASASIALYTITNRHTFEEQFNCQLDFGTLSYEGAVVSINSIDDSVVNVIKANKGTQYEYLVSEICEDKQLKYDRLDITSTLKFYPFSKVYGKQENKTPEGDEVVISIDRVNADNNPTYDLPLSYSSSSDVYDMRYVKIIDDANNPGRLITYVNHMIKKLDIHIKFNVIGKFNNHLSISIYVKYIGIEYLMHSQRIQFIQTMRNVDYHVYLNDVGLSDTDLIIRFTYTLGTDKSWFALSGEKFVTVSYTTRMEPININVIKPVVILNRLLKSINGEKYGIVGEIASGIDTRLDNSLIIAADSVRGISGAKLYTSYSKFVDWMEAVFGYVQKIDGNTVRFVHRDSLFSKSQVKDIGDSYSDFNFKIDESRIYSRVKVGYDKQDYDSINGRDEFHFTTEYSTGVNITDNVLELISKYRADVYGIEFLVQKRGKDTTDNESDNDVFFVCAELGADNLYILVRNGWEITGVLSADAMFNVMYWQRAMLEANATFIGMSSKILKYSSSEGNGDVVVNNIPLKNDFVIADRFLTCGNISFNTFDDEMPVSDDEIISITKDGLVYKGYVKEVSETTERPDGVKYELFVSSILKL